jgi:hypothetical protein
MESRGVIESTEWRWGKEREIEERGRRWGVETDEARRLVGSELLYMEGLV